MLGGHRQSFTFVLSNNRNISFKSDTQLTSEVGGLSLKYGATVTDCRLLLLKANTKH